MEKGVELLFSPEKLIERAAEHGFLVATQSDGENFGALELSKLVNEELPEAEFLDFVAIRDEGWAILRELTGWGQKETEQRIRLEEHDNNGLTWVALELW